MKYLALPAWLVLCALGAPRVASAQSASGDDETLAPTPFDPATCNVTDATKPAAAVTTPDVASAPVTWNGFDIQGTLTDPAITVRTLFEPAMRRHRALTDDARDDIRKIANAYGYHLIGFGTKDTPSGTRAVISLEPMPMVRHIDVDVKQKILDTISTPLLDDEIRRRMRVHTGSYLSWGDHDRKCELHDEQRRVEEYLRDEGFIDAKVEVKEKREGRGITLKLKVHLGDDYHVGAKIKIVQPLPAVVPDEEIRSAFHHRSNCIVKICWGTARFKRSRLSEDVQNVANKFHTAGFPAVRVRTDFDPLTSFDRRTKTVRFTVTVDTRRKLFVVFEGFNAEATPEGELRKKLTFDQASSSDDVEAAESAKALTAYLQERGNFDARVTWTRERFDNFDQLIYRIEPGGTRQVKLVELVGVRSMDEGTLRDAIGTREAKLSSSLFGGSTHASSVQLAADVDALVETYRRAGFRDARVRVEAATSPAALGSAAMTAALQATDRGQDLYVRYTIDEGQPTILGQVQISLGDQGDAITTPDQRVLCGLVLADLAELYADPQLATPAGPGHCMAVAANLKYREADAIDTRDRLKDRLFSHGRPRAKVVLETRTLGLRRVALFYKLTDVQPLTIGKIVIRGNFRTTDRTIRQLLKFDEGKPLTKDELAEGARRLRNTGLFDTVNIAMPDLENISEGSVNAVVEIAERYDYRAQIDLETGYSTYNSTFVTLNPAFKNLGGVGISLDLKGTIGFDLGEAVNNGNLKLKQLSAETTLRFPQWLSRRMIPPLPEWLAFQTELNAFHRRQDTPRFGLITTDGLTLSLLRTWQRQRIGTRSARALTLGPHYDLRNRERPVDVLRPLGADDDQTQVPISTRTGSVGASFEWEQRTDKSGTLSPLAPEAGFRFEVQASYAFIARYFGGQDTFLKLSTAGSKYWPIGSNLVLRADLRYDQGIPLGGAVLLPEVERFFAGGDSTVRGYEDDRLATEIIQVGVPPIGNTNQIRILPSGGNIRLMSSLDAQLRIWKLFATAVFVDAGMITNQWSTVTENDIRPSVGIALARIVTPFGSLAFERAIPLRPQLGDNPRGRFHLSFAARAQF